MNIDCSNCGKRFILPDDKVPQGKAFRLKCPSCKGIISVETGKPAPPEFTASDLEPEVFPPGSKVALIFVQNPRWKESAMVFFKKQGWYVSVSDDCREACSKLMINSYDFVIAEEIPGCVDLLAQISGWAGRRRREVNVVLLGNRVSSMQPAEAFIAGVNFYLNSEDSSRAEELLEQCCNGHKSYVQYWTMAAEVLQRNVTT